MITAEECRQLAAASETAVANLLKEIEPKIRKTAEIGKDRKFVVDNSKINYSVRHYTVSSRREEPQPIHIALIAELKKFGFGAEFKVVRANYAVGCVMGQIDETDPNERWDDYSVEVSW